MAGILANSASKAMVSGDTAPTNTVSGFVTGEQVTLSTTPTGTTYVWGESIPSGSAQSKSKLSGTTDASVTFTPDVAGLYVVTVVVDLAATYNLTLSVVASQGIVTPGAEQFTPVANAAVPVPRAGLTLYFSSDSSTMVTKDITGAVSTLGASGAAGGDLSGNFPNPTVKQAHLTDSVVPATPPAGTLILQSFNQQGFSVPHIYDAQGDAVEITRDNITVVRNITGSSLPRGTVVYVTGSTGTVPTVAPAKADSTTTLPAVGIMYDTTANNSYGRMMIIGNLENIDLSAYSIGSLLYVSDTVAGGLTATSPSMSQSIGSVLSNGAGNGVLQVFTRVVQRRTRSFMLLTPFALPTTNGALDGATAQYATNNLAAFITDYVSGSKTHGDAKTAMPQDWTGLPFTATFYWDSTSASIGNVTWGIAGTCYANGGTIDVAPGTAQEVTQAYAGSGILHATSATGSITLGGTPARGGFTIFDVYRLGTVTDTLAATVRLLGVQINYSTL